MPDHVHFFARPRPGAKQLSVFVRDWKRWTSREVAMRTGSREALWQPEFFDHVLRSRASYEEKLAYVRHNPIRAGLVEDASHWPWQGEIAPLSF